ncbi:hypothetical protein ABW19_dt0204669 [Dactylella cylindrospora]|nr:hypothetical protein ABW19_dt0204669 [Dactylella cylindrospora]
MSSFLVERATYPPSSFFGQPNIPEWIEAMKVNATWSEVLHAVWLQKVSIAASEAGIIGKLPVEFVPPWLLDENYVPASRQTSMYIIDAVFFGLALFMVLARIYTRAFIVKKFGIDDWFIVLALISVAGFTALQFCFLIFAGVGYHIWDVTPQQLQFCYKFIYFHLIGYIWCVTVIKMSILFLYRRIIPKNHGLHKVVIGFFIFHIIYFFAAVMTFIFQCNPVHAALSLEERIYDTPKCIPLGPLFYSFGIVHIFLDFALLTLPVKVVWKLNIPRRKKATTMMMFVMGALACFCPIMRMVTLDELLKGYDMTWTIYDPGMWGQLELTIGIICACIPPSKLLFKQMFEPISRTTSIVCRSFIYTPSPSSSATDVKRASSVLPLNEKQRTPPPSYGYDSTLGSIRSTSKSALMSQTLVSQSSDTDMPITKVGSMRPAEFKVLIEEPHSPVNDSDLPSVLPPAYASGVKSEKIATLDELEDPQRRPSLLGGSDTASSGSVSPPPNSYGRDRRSSEWTSGSDDKSLLKGDDKDKDGGWV